MGPFLFLLLLFFVDASGAGVGDGELVQPMCGTKAFAQGDPFDGNVKQVLDDLIAAAPVGTSYKNISPSPVRFVYGHASCSGSIGSGDCTACLRAAAKSVRDECGNVIGARIRLGDDCSIRYEEYPFQSESIGWAAV